MANSEDPDQIAQEQSQEQSDLSLHCLHIEGWAQDWRKSDGCFSANLISSPWRRYEDYNIFSVNNENLGAIARMSNGT